MFTLNKILPVLAATLAFAGLAFPPSASAQDVPSYANPSYASSDETIHGRILSIDGTFDIRVTDDRGFVDSVHLHQGTIINPTGLTLAPGMSVTITGYNAGQSFEANEIDAPYAYDGPAPVPQYYGPGWWYPGYAYGYGPSFSLILAFGNGRWYYEHHPWNGHWYDDHPYPYDNHSYGGRHYGSEPRRGGQSLPVGSPSYGGRSYGSEPRHGDQPRAAGAPSYGGRNYVPPPAYNHSSAAGPPSGYRASPPVEARRTAPGRTYEYNRGAEGSYHGSRAGGSYRSTPAGGSDHSAPTGGSDHSAPAAAHGESGGRR